MEGTLPGDFAIDAEVELGATGDGYVRQARLNVSLAGLERSVAHAILAAAINLV